MRGKKIFLRAKHHLKFIQRIYFCSFRIASRQITIRASARVNAYTSLISFRVVASLLKCFPSAFQEKALLGIHPKSFAGTEAKEMRVKYLYIFQYPKCFNIIGVIKQFGIYTRS